MKSMEYKWSVGAWSPDKWEFSFIVWASSFEQAQIAALLYFGKSAETDKSYRNAVIMSIRICDDAQKEIFYHNQWKASRA